MYLTSVLDVCVQNWREMNYRCMDQDELEDNTCKGICRILLSAPVRLIVILVLGESVGYLLATVFLATLVQ